MAARAIGHPIDVKAASIPTGLDRIAREHLADTIMEADAVPALTNIWQGLDFLNVARWAYHLDTSEALGHADSFDLVDGPLNVVGYVDYNSRALDMWTADVVEFGVDSLDAPHSQAHYPELGLSKVDQAGEAVSLPASFFFFSDLQKLTSPRP